MSAISVHRILLEGLPFAVFAETAGILFGADWLAGVVLVPVALGFAAAVVETARQVREARKDESSVAGAAFRGTVLTLLSAVRTYLNLGLWQGRRVYDAAALVAFVMGGTWWFFHLAGDQGEATVRWLSAVPLAGAGAGGWLRFRGEHSGPSPLFTDVMFALDRWEHKRRRADELAYENAISDRLAQLGFDVTQGKRLDDGREADIVVRSKGNVGDWKWNDVMVEMKAHMLTTNERDRAMGQIESYASTWPGGLILMVCGDLRGDLLVPLHEKVAKLRDEGRAVALVVKGRDADGTLV